MLFYVSGGVAAAKMQVKTDSKNLGWNVNDFDGTASVIAQGRGSKNSVDFGYVVGGGMEFRLTERWSLGLDYSYYQIPVAYGSSIEVSEGYAGSGSHYNVKGMIGDHLLRLNINYSLNVGY